MTEETSASEMIDRAQNLAKREGIPLSEAMARVEAALAAPSMGEDECTFEITVKLKPRIARWLRSVLPPEGKLTTEDRLAAYLPYLLGRSFRENRDIGRDAAEVTKGQAVTVRGRLVEDGKGAKVDV